MSECVHAFVLVLVFAYVCTCVSVYVYVCACVCEGLCVCCLDYLRLSSCALRSTHMYQLLEIRPEQEKPECICRSRPYFDSEFASANCHRIGNLQICKYMAIIIRLDMCVVCRRQPHAIFTISTAPAEDIYPLSCSERQCKHTHRRGVYHFCQVSGKRHANCVRRCEGANWCQCWRPVFCCLR